MNDTEWIEKGIDKHKHNYIIPCIYKVNMINKPRSNTNYWIYYYEVLMCDKCHSFKIKNISPINSEFSTDVQTEFTTDLPIIVGNHFNDYSNLNKVDELYFPDNYIWKKN